MDSALDELLQKSEATASLLIDKGGPLITQRGALEGFDATTLAALAAGSFAANEAIAGLVGESNFSSIYQQGEHHSLLVGNVGENLLLIVIFKTGTSVGVVKFYMATTVQVVACQLQRARARTPGETVDLVGLDMPDTSQLFKRKA